METRKLSKKVEHYFARARMALMRKTKWAFFGGLVMSLTPMESDDIETAGVDQSGLLVLNPQYFLGLDKDTRVSLVAHEVMHPAFKHFVRQGMRDESLWNIACDIWINDVLEKNGLVVAGEWLTRARVHAELGIELPIDLANSMSAEMIYNLLKKQSDEKKGGANAPSAGDMENSIGNDMQSGSEMKDAAIEASVPVPSDMDWDTIAIGASAAAKERKAGEMPGSEKERLGLKPPVIDWRQHLQKFFSNSTNLSKLSFRTPKRRFQHISVGTDQYGRPIPLTLPSSRPETSDIAFVFDNSGSMDRIKNDILGEVDGLRHLADATIWLMAGDTKKQFDAVIDKYDEIPTEFTGWGGTRFNWVFKEIMERNMVGIGGIIFATDGYNADVIEQRYYPQLPMIWLMYDNPHFIAPFGEVVHVPPKTR